MDPALLSVVLAVAFLAVMGGALVCFARAFRLRQDRSRHVRWAIAGAVVDLAGTAVVLVTHRVLQWEVHAYDAGVAAVHRGFAYVVTALLLVQIVGGARRWRVHRHLGAPFLWLYVVTYLLAVVAYVPR